MLTLKNIALVAILMLAVPTAASAAHHYHGYHGNHGCGYAKGMSWDMSDRDANGDGALSFEEFSASQQELMRSGFNMIDTDKDGKISAEEWNTFLKVHGMNPKK